MHTLEETYHTKIPVIAGGGVQTQADVAHLMQLGASGVQVGTRFVVTEECDAGQDFKNAYLRAKPEDIQIIKSPVGLAAVHWTAIYCIAHTHKAGFRLPTAISAWHNVSQAKSNTVFLKLFWTLSKAPTVLCSAVQAYLQSKNSPPSQR